MIIERDEFEKYYLGSDKLEKFTITSSSAPSTGSSSQTSSDLKLTQWNFNEISGCYQ